MTPKDLQKHICKENLDKDVVWDKFSLHHPDSDRFAAKATEDAFMKPSLQKNWNHGTAKRKQKNKHKKDQWMTKAKETCLFSAEPWLVKKTLGLSEGAMPHHRMDGSAAVGGRLRKLQPENNLYRYAMSLPLTKSIFKWKRVMPTEEQLMKMKDHSKKRWILELDLEHVAQNSYPLATEKNVIKSDQMSGYQKRLMVDLNSKTNSKTLVLILRVTLRDASQKTKPLSRVLGGCSCLAPARTFPAADKAAVIPI